MVGAGEFAWICRPSACGTAAPPAGTRIARVSTGRAGGGDRNRLPYRCRAARDWVGAERLALDALQDAARLSAAELAAWRERRDVARREIARRS